MTAQPTHHDLERKIDELLKMFGEASEDGKGGTGLIGQINRLTVRVDELTDLKNRGVGVIFAVGLFGVLIVLGIRQWIGNMIAHP